MKKCWLFLFASSLTAIAGVACAGIADRGDPAGAIARHALLIVNAAYTEDGEALRHPVADAQALTHGLREAGFTVVVRTDLTKEAMQTAIADFANQIKPGSAALIFFSGYGIQVAQQNYLIPINAQIWSEADVYRDGVPLKSVLAEMDGAGARVKLAIIDASRKNPFERRFRDRFAGLVSVTVPESTLIAYSGAPDTVVSDRPGDNSLFVSELLKEAQSPGSTAEHVFMAAARSVSRASDGKQVPWFLSSLAEPFYFQDQPLIDNPPTAERGVTPSSPPPQLASAGNPPSSRLLSDERAASEPQPGDQTGDVVAAFRPAERVPVQEIPRLSFQPYRGMRGQPLPLGLTLHGRADGAAITIAGLAPGMSLSTGHSLGPDSWRVPVADLARTWIGPPADFVGLVDLVAELHLSEMLVHRRLLQFEWAATPAVAAPPVIETQRQAATAAGEAAIETQRQRPPMVPSRQPLQLDRDEIALLIKRGTDPMVSGDLPAARVVLRRAAEAKDADAAMALAATYDPGVLRRLKVYGLTGDVAMARTWYEKAREFGSATASQRLELLAKGGL
jgi:hypothetical protein